MPAPNLDLITRREAMKSPNAPDQALSRQELADLVNKRLFKLDPKAPPVTYDTIAKLEQGVIGRPREAVRRAAFRAALQVETDAELGFHRPRRTRSTAPVDRQQFLRAAVGMTAGVALGQSRPTELFQNPQPAPVPSVVGPAEVAEVRELAGVFANWDATYGSGLIREAVVAQLRYCVELLNARCAPAVEHELQSAVGYLAHVAAFMAFDSYAHDDARRMFTFALRCAEDSADWHLRAKVLSSMARHSIWCGDPDTGLTQAELALVRSDRLTGTELAMLHTARARALAKLRRVEEAAAAVGAADEAFARARPHNDPPWMAYYDAAQHYGDTGHALWDTAMAGRFATEARNRLAAAVAGHDDRHARSRMISQIKLASLIMATGDPIEAATLGRQALDWTGPVRSRRAADDLRTLQTLAEPHQRKSEVAELTSKLGAVVKA
ncbi:XRE family transcriptional regulator [Crossiella sp. SN42]|uniref:XRE family transcriptional regulator n=1 Tax=Crossiella sp. SN42 TaxID=2944808 RepID=UPI00207D0919|nr:XRE family transcriptional regulator [Crossiella sp. SN42]MCO1575503.1 XRE family transcriptional regulator [Crossiella sp. SN42]